MTSTVTRIVTKSPIVFVPLECRFPCFFSFLSLCIALLISTLLGHLQVLLVVNYFKTPIYFPNISSNYIVGPSETLTIWLNSDVRFDEKIDFCSNSKRIDSLNTPMSFSTPGHYTHPYNTNSNLHLGSNAHNNTILNAATNTDPRLNVDALLQEECHQHMHRERELEKQHRQREEDLINSYEAEEDRIVVMLSRKLEQV